MTFTESSFWIRFVLGVLATWRVTHLLANEDGPADIIVRLRVWLGDRFIGKLMDCFKCLSLWVAAPAALFVSRKPLDWLFAWLALSGAACLLERTSHEPVVIESGPIEPGPPPAEGDFDHVLQSEEIGVAETAGDLNEHGGPSRHAR